jgi:hypothetical protein
MTTVILTGILVEPAHNGRSLGWARMGSAQFDELSSAVTTTMPARMMVAVIMVVVLSWF